MFRNLKKEGTLTIHVLTLVVLPIIVIAFFTTMLWEGQPQNLPVGVVDLDNSSTTRALVRRLDAFQTSEVVGHYSSFSEAREAMQHNEIYGFIYFPKGTTSDLLASRQPHISFYYSSASLSAGSLLFRDLKTITTLGSAAVGQATLRAKGFTERQAMAFLQPVTLDVHAIGNPWINYNVYLTTTFAPACIMLFIMLLTAYSIGMMLKHGTGKESLSRHNGNIWAVLFHRLWPQSLVFNVIMLLFELFVYQYLGFPHQGGMLRVIILGMVLVTSGQCFGLMIFGLIPSLRMSMSICSLWAVLSFSMVGTAFPAMGMDAPLQALAWLFPMRHYFMIYSICIFNDYTLIDVWPHMLVLLLFILSPLPLIGRIKTVLSTYEYIE